MDPQQWKTGGTLRYVTVVVVVVVAAAAAVVVDAAAAAVLLVVAVLEVVAGLGRNDATYLQC